jgi:type II secretory pathway pseudopilin PulG
MNRPGHFPNIHRRLTGMTLMEVVVAIGVVAFVVPLILGAISSTGMSRRNAEADTRSVWIARQVQQELLAVWAEPPHESVISTTFPFPENAASPPPKTLLYDRDGEFLAEGSPQDLDGPSKTPQAVYVIRINAENHVPPNFSPSPGSPGLALLSIEVFHPATSSPANRTRYLYRVVTPRQGIL